MKTRRTCVVLLLSLFLGCGCLSYRLTADQVVQDAQQALRRVDSCRMVLDIEFDTDLLKDAISVEVWDRQPDWLKIRVSSAQSRQLQDLAFATDGQQSVLYSPHSNQVLVGPADMVRMPSVIERLAKAWKEWILAAEPQSARLLAQEREGGLVVYKIEIPLAPSGYAQYWIDARQWWVRQLIYQDEYLGTGRISVREIDCLVDSDTSLSSVHSALDIPDGVPIKEVTMEDNRPLTLEEAQLAVSFPLRTPTYVPEGTDFSAAYYLDKNMALVYVGQSSFTLMQGPRILQVPKENVTMVLLRGQQASLVSDQEHDGIVLIWQEDGLQYSIAGSLDQEHVIRIADSLEQTFKHTAGSENVQPSKEQGQ